MKTFNLDEIFFIDRGFYGWCLDIIREIIPSVYESETIQNNFTNYMLKPLWRKYQFTNANYNNNERGINQFKNDFANQLQDVCVEFYSYVKANISHFEGLDKKQDIFKQVNSVVAPINATINQTENNTSIASGTTAQNINTTLLNDSVWLNIFNTYMSPQRKGEMLNRFNWLFVLSYYDDEIKEEYILEVNENLSMAEGNQVIEFDVDDDVSSVIVTINKPKTMIPDNIKEGVNIGGVLGSYVGRDLSDATATSDDILLGKVAYGDDYQRLVGTIPTYDYEGGEDISGIVPVGAINITENGNYDVTNYAQANVNVTNRDDMLQARVNATNSCQCLFYRYKGYNVDYIANLDTSNVTTMDQMFYECSNITTIPQLNTSNVRNMNYMFYNCTSLTAVPQLDTSNVTQTDYMFYTCSRLTTVPQLDVSNVFSMNYMFLQCYALKSILMYGMKYSFNISNSYSTHFEASDLVTILSNCQVLTSSKTLTIGSTNISKLNDVYVKPTGVELYEGITCNPCVICESTDEGAMLAVNYFTTKGWTLA